MNIVTVTPPLFSPVSLAEAWEQLRLTPTGSPASTPLDDQLERNIISATRFVELMTRTSMVSRTLRIHYASFPESGKGLQLHRGPVRSVSSVQYYDATNTLQTLASDLWYESDDGIKEVRLTSGAVPTVYDRPDAVRITYVAGFEPAGSPPVDQGDYAANVDATLKEAVLIQVELLVGNLSPEERTSLNNALRLLCGPYINQVLA